MIEVVAAGEDRQAYKAMTWRSSTTYPGIPALGRRRHGALAGHGDLDAHRPRRDQQQERRARPSSPMPTNAFRATWATLRRRADAARGLELFVQTPRPAER